MAQPPDPTSRTHRSSEGSTKRRGEEAVVERVGLMAVVVAIGLVAAAAMGLPVNELVMSMLAGAGVRLVASVFCCIFFTLHVRKSLTHASRAL